MPRAFQLWLMDADTDNFAPVLKGIREVLRRLEDSDADLQTAKVFFERFKEDGPLLLASADDEDAAIDALEALSEVAGGAINPDPQTVEDTRLEGVDTGRWQPREGEAGPQEASDPSDPDETALFERRLYDTSLLLMVLTEGKPVGAWIAAKQLQEATGLEFFDLVADGIRTTFGFPVDGEE